MNDFREKWKRNQRAPLDQLLDASRDRHSWTEFDSAYLDGAARSHETMARLCRRAGCRSPGNVGRSFAVIRYARPYNDAAAGANLDGAEEMGPCGRRYSLALLALLDALAAEPPGSPLAAPTPLDDLRASAFLVAGETAGARPNPTLVERAVGRVDRRLVDLHLPLRATGYLAARDALRKTVTPLLSEQVAAGGP